ncbi:MAG: hypothetical protein A4S09_16410 [Proteobacteria bacterium SG_bin7]|nr:MAG: hypothetical protein A4S09_16410 [Proteobacteria bacterium SG_bin7]
MEPRLSYLLILVGTLGLLAQTIYQVSKEKKSMEAQIKAQASAVKEGLKVKWRDYLLNRARENKLPLTYSLKWNRNGTELKSPFFPVKSPQMEWSSYRDHVKSKNQSAIRKFLEHALNRENSWDRIVAIEEWKSHTGNYPVLSGDYEMTLVNPEAKSSFKLLFEQFSFNKDFTYADNNFSLDLVFYRVQEDGSILAFLPSSESLKKEVLPEFLRLNTLSEASFGTNALELAVSERSTKDLKSPYWNMGFLFLSFFTISAGIFIYLMNLGEQRKIVTRRVSFLNQVVHELKTPLTGLKLHLQLIQRGMGERQNYEALNSGVERINSLFDDVVMMNRPFEKINPENLSAQTANNILNDLKLEFPELSIQSKFERAILADTKRLRVSLRNIIKNAIRYGAKAYLTVKEIPNGTEIQIRDHGPGVAKEEVEKIFSEFYRSENAKMANADGMGLGLFIVKKLCEEMNATIQIANPGEKGAIFVLTTKR